VELEVELRLFELRQLYRFRDGGVVQVTGRRLFNRAAACYRRAGPWNQRKAETMKRRNLFAAIFLACLTFAPARAQVASTVPTTPLGYCQLSTAQLGASIGLASCVRAVIASATGSGTNLTVTTLTSGVIKVGDVAVSGVGIPAGTTIVSQTSGTPGGTGVYVTSVATTISAAAATFGGIPPNATAAYVVAEVAPVRFRDDGAAPTAAVGNLLNFGAGGAFFYAGTLSAMRFIAASGSPLLNVSFYR
jgi:hypothetical protein